MNKKTSLIFFGLLFVAVFSLLLISALFKNSRTENVNESTGDTQGAYTQSDEGYIQYITTQTRKTVPANAPEQKDEPSVERNGADEPVIDVVVEEDDNKQTINFVSDTSNPFNYTDVSVSVSYCPQDSCPDGTVIPEDNNPVHNTCVDRLAQACIGHEGTNTTGGSTGGACSSAYPTSKGCFGAAPGTPVGLAGGGECVCTITTGNLCSCVTTKEPETSTTLPGDQNGFNFDETISGNDFDANYSATSRWNYTTSRGCISDVELGTTPGSGKYATYSECHSANLKYNLSNGICIGSLTGTYSTYQECKNALVVQQDQNSGDKCTYPDQCINYKRCTTDNVKNGTGATGDGCGVVTVDTTQGSGTTQDNSTDGGSKTPQQNNAYSGICCLQGKEVAISSSLCRANNGKDGSCENLTQGSYCSSTSQCKTGLVCGDKKCVTSAQAFTCGSDADCTSDKYCDWTGTRTCKTLLVANQCNPQNPGNRCEAYNLVCHSSGDCIDPNSQAVNDPNLGKRGFLCNLDGSCNDSDNDYCEREMFVCREKPTAKNGQPANTVQGQVLVDSYSQPIVQYTGQNNIPVNQQSNSSGALQDTTVNQSTETPLQRTVEIIKTDINESILETLIARLPQNDDIIEQASNSGQSVATVISNLTEVRTNMCANLSNCKISQSKTLTQMNGFYYACKGLNEADQFVSNLATSLNCDQDLGRFKIASAELLQQYEQDTGEVLAKPTTNYTPRVETRTCERSCYENSSDINQCIADCNASTEVPAKQTKFNNELEQVNTQSNLWSQVAKKPLADTDGSEVLCLGDNTTDICLNQTVNLVVYRGTDNTFGQCEQQNLNQRTGEWSCSFRENAIPCPYPPADLITTNPEEYQIATSCVLNGNSTQAAVDGNICAYDFDKGYCVTTSNVYEEAVEYQNNSAR